MRILMRSTAATAAAAGTAGAALARLLILYHLAHHRAYNHGQYKYYYKGWKIHIHSPFRLVCYPPPAARKNICAAVKMLLVRYF